MTIRTQYASGRNSFAAPSLTAISGSIVGGGITYTFWTLARNRVGYNLPSTPSTLVLNSGSGIQINASTFATYAYEGWREIIVLVSTTSSFTNSRVIYQQELYLPDNITPATINNVSITNDYVINGSYNITNTSNFPNTTNIPNGYRLSVTNNSTVYQYINNTSLVADNVNTFPAVNGIWSPVSSNSLTETASTYRKELFEVLQSELYTASLNTSLNNSVPILYYLYNDSSVAFSTGEVDLNDYCSDTSVNYSFDVQVLGYYNYTNNTLDITGITYVNTSVQYPDTKITLSKPLPGASALVVQITPNLELTTTIPQGIFISLYPKLNDYSTVDTIPYWGNPVVDLATLRAIPASNYIDQQVRFVSSLNNYFAFNASSTGTDDGASIILPNNNPTTGRWLAITVAIANGSIVPAMLAQSTIDLFSAQIATNTVAITSSTNYVIDLDTSTYDYYIISTPVNDGGTTSINVTATLTNNQTKAILIELRQNTGAVVYNSSLLFPSGNVPVFSGNGKNDLFVVELIQDGNGVLKKRIFLAQKDIG